MPSSRHRAAPYAVLRVGQIGAVLVSGDTSSTLRDVKATDRLRIASKPIDADELLSLITELLSVRKDT